MIPADNPGDLASYAEALNLAAGKIAAAAARISQAVQKLDAATAQPEAPGSVQVRLQPLLDSRQIADAAMRNLRRP